MPITDEKKLPKKSLRSFYVLLLLFLIYLALTAVGVIKFVIYNYSFWGLPMFLVPIVLLIAMGILGVSHFKPTPKDRGASTGKSLGLAVIITIMLVILTFVVLFLSFGLSGKT